MNNSTLSSLPDDKIFEGNLEHTDATSAQDMDLPAHGFQSHAHTVDPSHRFGSHSGGCSNRFSGLKRTHACGREAAEAAATLDHERETYRRMMCAAVQSTIKLLTVLIDTELIGA